MVDGQIPIQLAETDPDDTVGGPICWENAVFERMVHVKSRMKALTGGGVLRANPYFARSQIFLLLYHPRQ